MTVILELTSCPECGAVSEIVDRTVLESTDGPVEHARVRCLDHHVFNLPVAMLTTAPDRELPGASKPSSTGAQSR